MSYLADLERKYIATLERIKALEEKKAETPWPGENG